MAGQVMAAIGNPWEQIKARLATKISTQAYEDWVARTVFELIEGNQLTVTVPDQVTKDWMEQEFAHDVLQIIGELGLPVEKVIYAPRVTSSRGAASQGLSEPVFSSPVSQLNSRYRFENFVVGSCNQFAHAAAQAVAIDPSRRYNPLYLYGGVGMGKTHLMHAIGRALIARGKMRIIYTTSERFTNEVVSGIKLGRMPQLRERYRTADVLLIDDIQSLGSRDRTQEEFFHTFNELHDAQKQIVISSDCPPKEIGGLVERLRSRFEWGLMADIQAPDLETRMAILQKKAEFDSVRLPTDVCAFIAEKTKSNVRELEGALTKLIAYSSLTQTPISTVMARQVLKHLLEKNDRRITIDSIVKAVSEKYSIKPGQLKEKSNRKEIVGPRQVAMYIAKELTQASLPEIGRAFGGKHHTTVIHSIDKIAKDRQQNPELNKVINSVIDSFQ